MIFYKIVHFKISKV